MRDILTVLASLVILVLVAALIAPPLVPWEEYRPHVDRLIGRAAGIEARTEGRIELRLLPSPRIRLDRLRLGSSTPDTPSLDAAFIKAEIALTPLIRGEVRFTETRVGRAEIRMPTSQMGTWQLPAGAGSAHAGREWAVDNLLVSQLLLTTQVPTTGRTDQFYAENVSIEGQKLVGPWRVEGLTAGVPFRLVTGELGADRSVQIKLVGGGDRYPRFDVDFRIAFAEPGSRMPPSVSGAAKVLFGPPAQVAAAGIPIPVAIQTSFKTVDRAVELDPLTLEGGEGGASVRLAGTGRIDLDDPRISLKLEGRRLDADSFLLSSGGQDFLSRLPEWSLPPVTIPVDLDLTLNSIGLAQDELTNLVFRASFLRGRAKIDKAEFLAPGDTKIALEGEVGLTTRGGANGRVAIASAASDRLARYLNGLGVRGPALALLDGRPLEASADVVLAAPITSFRNMRVRIGDGALTGNLRYTAPEGQNRGRLEAQVALQGVDLSQLPQVNSVFDATQQLDVGFILDARDVRYGQQRGAGRISARILSDGPALLVETLDITDVAGANARVSGRIAPDGSGRIAGKVTAKRAAPLVDLIGSVWIGGVSKLVPYFLREGELDLDVVTERAGQEGDGSHPRLRTTARGMAAGGRFDADVITADGTTESLTVRVATDNTGRWVDRPELPILRLPSSVELRGVRVSSGQFNVAVTGDVGGVRVNTTRPFTLNATDDVVDSGEADLTAADITPFLVLLGDGAGVDPPVPVQIRVTLGRERDASLLAVSGKVGGGGVQARLAARSRSDISGNVTLDRLSLPWLTASLALNAPIDPRAQSLWSNVRFGQSGRLITGGQATFKVARLELGRGLSAENAGFTLLMTPEGLTIRALEAELAGGRLNGTMTINRQGALASVTGEGAIRDAAIAELAGRTPIGARLSANLKFGASGETLGNLVANLGGAGDIRLKDLQIANADPGAINRAVARLLSESDPLQAGRLQAVVSQELGRGPLRAAAVAAPATLVGGVLRLTPISADAGEASWQGAAGFDLRTLTLDARGTLIAKTQPKGWTGAPPAMTLSWRGPLSAPEREIDVGPLTNGVAAIVLQRELEKIEAFEVEANERQRQSQRRDMERARERERQAAEEAARQTRQREEAERLRLEAERTRLPREPSAFGSSALPSLPPPIDIRPPPQVQQRPGG